MFYPEIACARVEWEVTIVDGTCEHYLSIRNMTNLWNEISAIFQILFCSCDTDGVIAVFYYSGSGSDVSDRVERVEWLQIVNIEIRDPDTLQKLGVHVDQLAGLRVPSHLQPDMWAVFSGVGKIGYRCQKWINADQTLIISWILLDAIINRS